MKIFKNEDLGLDIFEKGQILRPFSDLVPPKLKIVSTKFNGTIYACRVFYLPILEESKGGGFLKKASKFDLNF